jgi:hypothetical protein
MSSLIVNIRFWYWHLQIERGFTSIKWVKNPYISAEALKYMTRIEVLKFFKIIN